MKDLSSSYRLTLSAGESMAGGNTIDAPDAHKYAFGAPGSPSIHPIPDRVDHLVDTAGDSPARGRTVITDSTGAKPHAAPATAPDSGTLHQDDGYWTRP